MDRSNKMLSDGFQIQHASDADEASVQWVLGRLREYNTEKPGSNDFTPLRLFLRDESGVLQGGLIAWTLWSWMHIDALWVEEGLRGRGLGLALLKEAEEIAMIRACTLAEVDTFSFQSPGFYEKAGYSIFGQLEKIGGKFTRYYLRKELSPKSESNKYYS